MAQKPTEYRNSPKWKKGSLKELKELRRHGVLVGKESDALYVGRFSSEGELVPCTLKLLADDDDKCCCYIVLSNKEPNEQKITRSTSCEMLVNSNGVQMEWKKCGRNDPALPTGRLQAGKSNNGENYFIGRKMVENEEFRVVKVFDDEKRPDEVQVLVCTALTFDERSPTS